MQRPPSEVALHDVGPLADTLWEGVRKYARLALMLLRSANDFGRPSNRAADAIRWNAYYVRNGTHVCEPDPDTSMHVLVRCW